MGETKSERQLEAIRALVRDIADKSNINAWVRLWDGARLPLGRQPTGKVEISIAGPGVIGAILRRPTLDTVIRQYIAKGVDFTGGTLVDLGRELNARERTPKLKGMELLKIGARLTPVPVRRVAAALSDQASTATSKVKRQRTGAENKDYVQFHYDLSNDFYALFLDPEMVYSCGYFTDWANGVEQAQRDKLEMICRKLRLKPGDRMLDIGSGWGGLVCHAAKNLRRHRARNHAVAGATRLCEREGPPPWIGEADHAGASRLSVDERNIRQDRVNRHV